MASNLLFAGQQTDCKRLAICHHGGFTEPSVKGFPEGYRDGYPIGYRRPAGWSR